MLNVAPGRPARLRYTISAFQVIVPGDHVVCAVTGAKIALENLRYWSAELQEPYATAEASARRYAEAVLGR
ncbi:MAG: DUF2093 domain-containing protein [Sphingomonadaceae bacterium]|nr:DUF2093 domain-containing protein [Sphingomonadaceae bacterium]